MAKTIDYGRLLKFIRLLLWKVTQPLFMAVCLPLFLVLLVLCNVVAWVHGVWNEAKINRSN